jgi:hypothetical protein
MLRLSLVLLLPLLGSACEIAGVSCSRPGIPSVVARVRNQFGKPAAIGSAVTIRKRGYVLTREGFQDSLRVWLEDGHNEDGVFELFAVKPWHEDAYIRRVSVSGDACGVVSPTQVDVTLELLPGAPPVRQVVLNPNAPFLDCSFSAPLTAHVEADDSVSGAVTWLSRDTAIARVSDGRLGCSTKPGTTYVLAVAAADPSVRDSLEVEGIGGAYGPAGPFGTARPSP